MGHRHFGYITKLPKEHCECPHPHFIDLFTNKTVFVVDFVFVCCFSLFVFSGFVVVAAHCCGWFRSSSSSWPALGRKKPAVLAGGEGGGLLT
jgi:hypothetical protein